jgi:inosine guanosine and xanthosine phosphorylase family
MLENINSATNFLKKKFTITPEIGIILGTGLGALVNEIEIIEEVSYTDIPHFAVSTVESHSGKLILGKLGNKTVVAMQGRFHFYEGYTFEQVTFPVRVMQQLGIKKLVVSNAAGGVNPAYKVGELMVIRDHINGFPGNPLIGKNLDTFGPKFVDMFEAYNPEMRKLAADIALKNNIEVKEGVYYGLTGPMLETPAEYKMIRILGADAVGMSTIPEITVARHMDIPCFAISIITDLGVPGKIKK